MKRRWFAVVGTLVVVLDVVLAVDVDGLGSATLVATLVGVGGVLFVLGGLDALSGTVAWYRFVGGGALIFGAVFVVSWIVPVVHGGGTTAAYAMAAAGAVNALLLGVIGVDWFRGGYHFDLSRVEPGPIFGAGSNAGQTEDP